MEISIRQLSQVVETAAAARESSARDMLQGHQCGWAKPWGRGGFPVALIHSSITPGTGRGGPDAVVCVVLAVRADVGGRYL